MPTSARQYSLLFMSAILCILLVLTSKPVRAETTKVSGHGETVAPVLKKQKDQAAANQTAMETAENVAKAKAISQAVLQVAGGQDALGSKMDQIVQAAMDNSATFVVDKQITSAGMQGNNAVVELVLQVDAKALRSFLETNFSLNATAQTEGKFKLYILSYTLEGMDPDRSGPPKVLHEEITDDQKGVHQSTYAASDTESSKNSNSSSYAASKAETDRGQVSANTAHADNGSINAQQSASSTGMAFHSASASGSGYISTDEGSANARAHASEVGAGFSHNSGSASVNANHSESDSSSLSENHDKAKSANVDAKKAASTSQYSSTSSAGSSYEDTSHFYHKVVDYADPTKKGAALSNEVRAELEGMMTTLGFDVATIDVAMMGRDFPTEDDLVNAVLNEMRHNPAVTPADYVAIALNSFTPVSVATHQFTSKVTYRVVRVKDGLALLPAKDIVGDSGDRAPSDDVARTYAVKSAMMKVDDIMPAEIKQAMQKLTREQQRTAAAESTYYIITVDNATTLSASTGIRTALTNTGFKVERSINGLAKTQTLTVTLNGKNGQDVMNAIEGAVDTFEIETMDDHETRVKVK